MYARRCDSRGRPTQKTFQPPAMGRFPWEEENDAAEIDDDGGGCRAGGYRNASVGANARRDQDRDRARHAHRPVGRGGDVRRVFLQRREDALRGDQRRRRHPRPQDPIDHRGPGLPGAESRAGVQQADQPRQRVRLRGASRHAHEQRLLQGPARGRRAEPVPALGGTLDVRALRSPQILRRCLLRRPDTFGC